MRGLVLFLVVGSMACIVGDASAQNVQIVEIMYNGAVSGDTDGEWVELFNPGSSAADVGNWTLSDGDTEGSYTIPTATTIPADGFLVLCFESDPALNDSNQGCDLEYGASAASLNLNNAGDDLTLRDDGGTVIDIVTYGGSGWPSESNGQAIVFIGSPSDDNDVGTNWTAATACDANYDCTSSNSLGSPGTQGEAADLPVELVAFEALVDGATVELRWETASETNNAGFEIQHIATASNRPSNIDHRQWDVLGFVEGHGTTATPQVYRHRVTHLAPGTHRFRLKQIDFDGTFEYSPEVEVAVGVPETHRLTAPYPNPFNPGTSFSLTVARAQHVRLAVYDLLGREVARLFDGPLPARASHAFRFDAVGLPSGHYVLRATGETFTSRRMVTLLR